MSVLRQNGRSPIRRYGIGFTDDVRFCVESRRRPAGQACPLCASRRHLRWRRSNWSSKDPTASEQRACRANAGFPPV
jgi:hypothetical protein